MPGTIIRRARIEDAETIARLARALSAAEGGPVALFDAAICRHDGFGAAPRFSTLLAEVDGRAAGYALYHPSYDTDRVVRAVWLADLYVESWARDRGLGRRLAAKVASLAAAAGEEAMHWAVLRRNAAARRFYARFASMDERLLHCHLSRDAQARLAGAPALSPVRIRPAVPTDSALLGRLLRGLLLALGEEAFEADVAPRLAADGFGAEPRFSALIAEAGAEAGPEVAGYALFWPFYDTETGGPWTFLSDLLVEAPWRGRGVAEDLMAEVARRAVAAGHLGTFWEVLEGNGRARAFYRRFAEESDEAVVVTCAGADFQRLAAEESPTLA